MASLPVIAPGSVSPPRAAQPRWTEEERRQVAADLASAVEGEVRFGRHDRMLYATDASLYQVEPLGVVLPASIEDAVRAAAFCVSRRLPILPRGGGTSLAGQCVNEAVVLDFSARCRHIVEINEAERWCIVEPGITVDDLNAVLSSRGLFFAPDPATSRQANIGGCIGNNAAGARSIMYGRTSENILGVEALLTGKAGGDIRRAWLEAGAAGRDPFVRELTLRTAEVVQQHAALIRERFPRTLRRNAGYNLDLILQQMNAAGDRASADEVLNEINLAHLLCGSEGTLAVTLRAKLKLQPVPAARGLAVIGFASLDEAVDAVGPILATRPSAVELLDDTVLDLASANTEYRRYVELMPSPASGRLRAVLYVEYFADAAAEELKERFESLDTVLARHSPSANRALYTQSGDMAAAWKLRKAGEPLLHGMPGHRKPLTFIEDNAVPVEHLGRFVRELRAIIERHGTKAAYWAHASVGVLHVRPFLDLRDEGDRLRVQQIATEAADLARTLGGVMSGEHGDGRVRGPLLERFYGAELMQAFREVKAIFDPGNLLNPGNIVAPGPVESIVEKVRARPGETFVDVPRIETYFEYDDQHGFRGAVEMCNGAGVCRKTSGGTMCPSYMALLDERHATRGRGNALRLAITGQFGADRTWNDPETLETLDLCLSCKACKSECPSNVDIARLKAEYTAQGYRASGAAPLRAQVLGRVRMLNRLASFAPGLSNWMGGLAPIRAVVNRVLGLSPKRSLPRFSRPLSREFARSSCTLPADAPTVVLFGDCFTMYNESTIGLAARHVLEAFGYRVRLLNAGCCGRAMISMGMLENAIEQADASLAMLRPAIEDPSIAAILVVEPSCLSAMKDDWLELKLKMPRELRQQLAVKARLVEDFIESHWESHPRHPELAAPSAQVLLHGHCHQKALWGAESTGRILRRLCGDQLTVLDTGCCGMAGSFGYSRDKYDLSMKIGELSLFPAVRGADEGACVVAPGTSCRHQIHDGTGRRAMHPVEFIASLLS